MNSSDKPALVPTAVIEALSNPLRWDILRELVRGEPLPVIELARRTGAVPANLSKHALLLQRAGLLERGYGQLYRIPARFLLADQPNAIDLGIALLRLDRLDPPAP